MNPFGSVGTTTVDAGNPLMSWIDPILQILVILGLAILVWRAFSNYMKGAHAKIAIEVVFGILVLLIIYKPSIFGVFVGWLASKIS